MKILLLGYGKMGKVIEKTALERGHQIVGKIDINNRQELARFNPTNTDVAIEFSAPEAAYQNLKWAMGAGVPTVCGTTGWLQHRPEIESLCAENAAAFFYASNYSIGVHLFFRLNQYLAKIVAPYQSTYDVSMTEIHHTEKKDAPSGTAITLAEGIFAEFPAKKTWVNQAEATENELPIVSLREGNVPGTHVVRYESAVDTLEIQHVAHSRDGFALGAVVAAEWLKGRQGVFGMDDLLGK
ncbi:MAG: 4-hydroxy-tetrahydrodipicolinate reductase [Runella slithyformis]|nr:MAG: 4-hydroxy-tetrahydrodipicolinate reductase [Runella slithyformis]TAF92627.1 MAG: 4-hydroxy-tetrahydrodipicolinate reductase [Runella sp.]TAG23536.1 MAG: 4-hydroxy-tetrahydrodipicolinate reductase [Cytophagales bacterium]TAG42729.1 MAG: 4-hydroxy-tetrahydrodipicolinate reductase [Cytophagia bacterium]TAF27716.1 MAG: 4-hydroxy-tetrahydrodipicolinate reductase [Runella slithyformis]